MNTHKNARLTPRGRERMVALVAGGQTPKTVGQAVGVCPRTVRKWVKRFEAEGQAGLQDRSSRPRRLRRPTPPATVERIEALRRSRLTGKAIAAETAVSPATVSRIVAIAHDTLVRAGAARYELVLTPAPAAAPSLGSVIPAARRLRAA